MVKHGDIILLDTTAIIGAHKYKCWDAIVKCFRLETVDKCIEECGTGDTRRRDRVPIDVQNLAKQMTVHHVEQSSLVVAALKSPRFSLVDPGEREILAHAFTKYRAEDIWYVSSQDIGCVHAGNELGFLERFISFEEMTRALGLGLSLKHNYTEKWLQDIRTKIKLEQL